MTFAFKDNHMSVTNVEQYLCLRMDNGIENGFVYFNRTDGSIWQYDIAANVCREMIAPQSSEQTAAGDINGDGFVSDADYNLANNHVRQISLLKDYAFSCADINNSGHITTFDTMRINSHSKGKNSLWQ